MATFQSKFGWRFDEEFKRMVAVRKGAAPAQVVTAEVQAIRPELQGAQVINRQTFGQCRR